MTISLLTASAMSLFSPLDYRNKSYPQTIVNKGVNGEDSAAGLLRLPSLLQANTASRFFLIQYGTNDVLYGVVPSGLGLMVG